jgi:hypothetical protein
MLLWTRNIPCKIRFSVFVIGDLELKCHIHASTKPNKHASITHNIKTKIETPILLALVKIPCGVIVSNSGTGEEWNNNVEQDSKENILF